MRFFVEVVRAGGFAAAARRLGVPSNTLSRSVQQLEEQLKSRLLHRSTRKLTLTAAGESLYARSAEAIEKLTQAGRDVLEEGGLPSGEIRVAATADFVNETTTTWIGEFLAAYPQIRLEFVLSDAPADMIAECIDIAFRSSRVDEAQSMIYRRFEHYFVLAASPAYLEAKGMPADLQALAEHDCLGQGHGARASSMSWQLQGAEGSTEVPIKPRFIANTAGAVVQAALSGFGIALLPMMLVAPHLKAGRLIRVLPEYWRDGGGLKLVFPSRRQVPRAVAAFAEFAEAHLQAIGREHGAPA